MTRLSFGLLLVVAFSGGAVRSSGQSTAADIIRPSARNVHVIAVGINRYERNPLKEAVRDARSFAQRIQREHCTSECEASFAGLEKVPTILRVKVMGGPGKQYNREIKKVSVTLLLDDAATLDGIDRAFANVIKEATKNDVVVFFFAGRSTYSDSSAGPTDVSLCTFDSQCDDILGKPSTRTPSTQRGITGSKLRLWLDSTSAERQLVVLDSCSHPQYANELLSVMSGSDPVEAGLTPRDRAVVWSLNLAIERPDFGGLLTHLVTGSPYLLTDAPFGPAGGTRYAFERDLRAREAEFIKNRPSDRLEIGLFFERDFLTLLARTAAVSPVRGLGSGTTAKAKPARIYDGRARALIVGTNSYKSTPSWPNLTNPVLDARAIAEELETTYGFEVTLLVDPDKKSLNKALRELQTLTYGPNDQVFVFFAGHGYYDERMNQGFLVPTDAQSLGDDEDRATYVPFAQIEGYVDKIPAAHILVGLDACFGGTFSTPISKAATRGPNDPSPYDAATRSELIERKLKYRSRLYVASGGKEYVPDGRPGRHSPFAAMFLEALRSGGGDDNVLTMAELHSKLERIAAPAPEVRAGAFGDNQPGGDFLFIGR